MIANYGCEDGSGTYYIRIDTHKCATCRSHICVEACPEKVFQLELDDFDDEVIAVRAGVRNKLRSMCVLCKQIPGGEACLASCTEGAITFTW